MMVAKIALGAFTGFVVLAWLGVTAKYASIAFFGLMETRTGEQRDLMTVWFALTVLLVGLYALWRFLWSQASN